MIDVQFTTDDTNDLKSGLQDHVLLLAEVERREADETLRPVIAAQKALQAARLAAMEAHFAGDQCSLINCLYEVVTASCHFIFKARNWRSGPLPQNLADRSSAAAQSALSLYDRVTAFHEAGERAIQAGTVTKSSALEAQDAWFRIIEEGLQLSELQYSVALDILQYRMNATDPELH